MILNIGYAKLRKRTKNQPQPKKWKDSFNSENKNRRNPKTYKINF